jgi:acetyl-CoA C-acetyltransferase
MNLTIVGAASTKFGELWSVSPRKLAREAVSCALDDAGLDPCDIDALLVGNMLAGSLGGQDHLGALFAEELKLNVPAWRVEGACASGGLAVHAAVTGIRSGLYRTALVLGVEKMTDYKPEEVARALMGAGSDEERTAGATFPGLYACLARAHMEKYKTTEKEMASVAVKNHYHASLNSKAQFHSLLTEEKVLSSSRVADPLKLYDCSPITDGASAVVITSRKSAKGVQVSGSAVATDSLGLSGRQNLTEIAATRKAAKSAYQQAGMTVREVDVAEVHDCFTIAEILAMEDLGLFPKGRAGVAIRDGRTTLGTKSGPVVNTSGGLKGCGHPVGATGVKQIVEVVDQLLGRAGKRQVGKNKIGLTQNVGGSGATAVVHILKQK